MVSSVFLQSIATLTLLAPALLEKLQELCPFLSDQERGDAFAKLSPLQAAFTTNRKEAVALGEERAVLVHRAQHEFMPLIHAAVEEDEREPALAQLSADMLKQ